MYHPMRLKQKTWLAQKERKTINAIGEFTWYDSSSSGGIKIIRILRVYEKLGRVKLSLSFIKRLGKFMPMYEVIVYKPNLLCIC